jgi:hypothetical protein
MDKQKIKTFAASNGINASYSGKSKTWHFTKGIFSAARAVGKGLTEKMLSNTFRKLNPNT